MTNASESSIAVAIYTHPEYYPPLLNTIDELAEMFSDIQVITRNLKDNHWNYPGSVNFFLSGEFISIRDSEQKSIWWKMFSFLKFTQVFFKVLKRWKPKWVMCNDHITLFSFRLIRPFLGYTVRLWYHNHDVIEDGTIRKLSVGGIALKSERKYFHRINLFTLPSRSRLSYFPLDKLKGDCIVIPNYPSIRRMTFDRSEWKNGMELKILYQGHIGEGHGLEKMIDFAKLDSSLKVTIIGPGEKEFIQFLKGKVAMLGIDEQVLILNPVSYSELSKITLDHHVGWAVYEPLNIAFRTAASASNKIYEYAAAGLPIIYYKNEHYLKFLGGYTWAFPSDLSETDLKKAMIDIQSNYESLSLAARTDFLGKLNFGTAFAPACSYLMEYAKLSDK